MSDLEANPPVENENLVPTSAEPPEEDLEAILVGEAQETEEVSEGAEGGKGSERADGFRLEAALADINKAESADAKLEMAIDLMEMSLAQAGAPQFKSFWELRKVALELFKENIAQAVRLPLWARYTDLTKEARRLKEILDEQTAFAVEQIEIAIKALEDGLAAVADRLQTAPDIDFGPPTATLQTRYDYYRQLQRELQLLNAEATRINALRKELIKTEMRVRQKNKFFQRLSAAGDLVFPRRKELIKEVSDSFLGDIEGFVNRFFTNAAQEESLFFLREEIKGLQTIAKVLTLNTRSFTQTRTRLSECWEKIKIAEKERKKDRLKKKAQYKEQADALALKIDECAKAFEAGTLSTQEANKQFDAISSEMRNVELGRDEVIELREKLQEAQKPIRDKIRQVDDDRKKEEQAREDARRAKVIGLRERIEALLNPQGELSVDAIMAERDAILAELADKGISRIERLDLEKQIKPVRDLIADRRAKALMTLSEDDQNTLQQLRDIHKERLALRLEIKAQLENFRKAIGSSGLDFEQALSYQEQQRLEKERLDKADQSIREIEKKISELEAKI